MMLQKLSNPLTEPQLVHPRHQFIAESSLLVGITPGGSIERRDGVLTLLVGLLVVGEGRLGAHDVGSGHAVVDSAEEDIHLLELDSLGLG